MDAVAEGYEQVKGVRNRLLTFEVVSKVKGNKARGQLAGFENAGLRFDEKPSFNFLCKKSNPNSPTLRVAFEVGNHMIR